ncbi:MAG: hypothetical protein WD187_04270 [Candidatus Woykebacteria bacterium]
MLIALFLTLSLLFYCLGILFFTANEVREPTFGKLYFSPFYEKTGDSEKLVVPRKLRDDVRIILSWYFIVVAAVMPLILINSNI